MSAAFVVFAYGEVGVRCLRVLLSAGVDVRLVVTHVDDPEERRWFGSVAELAADHGLPCIAPIDANDPQLITSVTTLAPDFIFSFYYRFLLGPQLIAAARRGALNMHGSLLPKFRGRAPVNWAIVRGATETGATLHHMVTRADAGDIVDQLAVPILQDDDALAVFRKVALAAEIVLARSLPKLIDGSARATPQRIVDGEYFGRRRPEDGRIDWSRPAQEIHNLVRAVAPPYPGAFAEVLGEQWMILRTRVLPRTMTVPVSRPRLTGANGRCIVDCADGQQLLLLSASTTRGPIDLASVSAQLERVPIELTS